MSETSSIIYHSNPYLEPNSYTAQRLRTAPPEHLYLTTRRYFIGPIREGWLKNNRKHWYKHHLRISLASRAPSLSSKHFSLQRRLSGLEGPSATATYRPSFPRLAILDEREDEDQEATTEVPPGVRIQRSSRADGVASGLDRSQDGAQDGLPTSHQDAANGSSTAIESGVQDQPDLRSTLAALDKTGYNNRRPSDRGNSTGSFVTAREGLQTPRHISDANGLGGEGIVNRDEAMQGVGMRIDRNGQTAVPEARPISMADSNIAGQDLGAVESLGPIDSTSSLLGKQPGSTPTSSTPKMQNGDRSTSSMKLTRSATLQERPPRPTSPVMETEPVQRMSTMSTLRDRARAFVHFDVPEDGRRAHLQAKARLAQSNLRMVVRPNRSKPGQVVKTEKMLVQIEFTTQAVPNDLDENESRKIDTLIKRKWRQYLVVCRVNTDEDAEYLLQMYLSRDIPAIQHERVKTKPKYAIKLARNRVRVNLFSSLDKTIVVWTPAPNGQGTVIFIMQPRAGSSSVEWYTFLQTILGWSRASELQVNVPDLSISIRLDNPFEELETSKYLLKAAQGDDDAMVRTMEVEQEVAGKIIQRCLEELRKSPDIGSFLDSWVKQYNRHIGLVWRRYDRLEWIHGNRERKMYGTIAMMKTHELELRPQIHYPDHIEDRSDRLQHNHACTCEPEPHPIEGFLVRLTSRRGIHQKPLHQKLGLLFYKHFYFSTHDQFLVFSREGRAYPPPPPKLPALRSSGTIPSAHEIADKIPLVYEVNPYPLADDKAVSWLKEEHHSLDDIRYYDKEAQDEAERKARLILTSDGYINLCSVRRVRHVRGATPVDANIDEGLDVDFDEEVPNSRQEDGVAKQFDDERTFELVMLNDKVVRLQAHNIEAKEEWVRRLRDLIRYWKRRTTADMALYRDVRRQNLKELGIDEEEEAHFGQFAKKWEVTKTYASPLLYNVCGFSGCRTIHMSGTLYHKPKRRAAFMKCSVMLCDGQLLLFQDTLRKPFSGAPVKHIHHERTSVIKLKDSYIYSGLLTENDLLYRNRTFDSRQPGHHALPRIYRDDGWRVTDEDTMTCFVIWMPGRRRWLPLKSEDPGGKDEENEDAGRGKGAKWRRVSALGVTGRSVVFRARSRVERDHWVMALGAEIEKMRQGVEFRLTEVNEKKG